MEAQEKQGSGERRGSPGPQAAVLLGGLAGCTGRGRPKAAIRGGQQDTHSGTHEAGGSSFAGNALQNKKGD